MIETTEKELKELNEVITRIKVESRLKIFGIGIVIGFVLAFPFFVRELQSERLITPDIKKLTD